MDVTFLLEKQLHSPGEPEALCEQRYPPAERVDSRVVPQGTRRGGEGRLEDPKKGLSLRGKHPGYTGRKGLGSCGLLFGFLTWGLSLVRISLPTQHLQAWPKREEGCPPSTSPGCSRSFFLSLPYLKHRTGHLIDTPRVLPLNKCIATTGSK